MAKQTTQEIWLQGIVDLPKEEAILLLEAGYLLVKMQKYKEAFELFKGVASLIPHSEVPCLALGNLFSAQGKEQMALKEYKEALRRAPSSALAHAHIAEILLFQKKFDEALKMIKKAQELDPKGSSGKYAAELLHAYEMNIFS